MSDETPILYVLIVFLVVLVAFLLARIASMQRYEKALRKAVLKLEGKKSEMPEDDPQDELGA